MQKHLEKNEGGLAVVSSGKLSVGEEFNSLNTHNKDKEKLSIKKPDEVEKPKSLHEKLFYCVSLVAIAYSFGSLLRFLYWKFGKS